MYQIEIEDLLICECCGVPTPDGWIDFSDESEPYFCQDC
jgi:hypothetical protein